MLAGIDVFTRVRMLQLGTATSDQPDLPIWVARDNRAHSSDVYIAGDSAVGATGIEPVTPRL
jgi:hypothetical protein